MLITPEKFAEIMAQEFPPPKAPDSTGDVSEEKETYTRAEVEALIDAKTKEIIEMMKDESEVNENGKGNADENNGTGNE